MPEVIDMDMEEGDGEGEGEEEKDEEEDDDGIGIAEVIDGCIERGASNCPYDWKGAKCSADTLSCAVNEGALNPCGCSGIGWTYDEDCMYDSSCGVMTRWGRSPTNLIEGPGCAFAN